MTYNDAKMTQTKASRLAGKLVLSSTYREWETFRLTQYDAKQCKRLHANRRYPEVSCDGRVMEGASGRFGGRECFPQVIETKVLTGMAVSKLHVMVMCRSDVDFPVEGLSPASSSLSYEAS